MYWLYGIDTVLRITAALLLLFVGIPALAWPRPASFTRLDWFFWNLGVGITLLTLAGQLFTLLNVASTPTYLLLFATIIVLCRAKRAGVPPLRWVREAYRQTVLFALRVMDSGGQAILPVPSLLQRIRDRRDRLSSTSIASWSAILFSAAVTRFYRPFATANLGFSDTYVHLYLMRLLDEGRQVDPAWGPYPRGMHFLLLPIERLTNADTILLMNFFGAFSGVLLTLAAAYAAQRVTKSTAAALVAGLLFATMIGGARQYFALGGSVSGYTANTARELLSRSYDDMTADAGEFDVLLTAFQRQTSTLPQELAIVLLLPAVLFMIDWLRTRDRWRLAGFIGCTAAIAAIHSGVAVPLVALCAAAALAVLLCRSATIRDVVHAAGFGAIGIALGSTWMLGFLRYSNMAATEGVSVGRNVGGTALYYFPFLRSFAGDATGEETAYMMLTPFLIGVAVVALLLGLAAWRLKEPAALCISLGTLFFILTHAASVLGIPEIVEVRRNVTWLALTVSVLLGIAVTAAAARLPRRAYAAIPALLLVVWLVTTPNLFAGSMRARLLDYSGYGATTYAVLRISQDLEPFTWTLVSYGQEYPMVLGRGFHLNGADFLEQFDPAETPLRIPTPHVFIAVEKTPHRFQINNWATRFDRGAVEERLQTWCMVYGLTHRNIRVFLDDENVRIYQIIRPEGRT